MDIARPDIRRKKRRRTILLVVAGTITLVLVTVGLSRLGPALPTIESPAFTDTVKRGEMLCEVRGNGTLVPDSRILESHNRAVRAAAGEC